MAWESHGKRRYFYRGVRSEGKVKKVYYGAGAAGEFAAEADALRRAERLADEKVRKAEKDRLDLALALTRDFTRACELLATAALLAAGFHRPSRHEWRRWRHGRRALNESC